MLPFHTFLLTLLVLAASWSLGLSAGAEPSPGEPAVLERTEPVDFDRDILPLVEQNCLACHNRQQPEAGLNLESREAILRGSDSGPIVAPGAPGESLLVARVAGGEEPLMPPEDNAVGAQPFSPEQLDLLKLWIEQGALPGTGAPDNIAWQSLAETMQPINAIAASPTGQYIAAGRGNDAILYDRHTLAEQVRLIDPAVADTLGKPAAHLDIVQSIAIAPDGRQIATGGYRTVKLWRPVDAPLPIDETPLAHAAGLIARTPDGTRLALVNAAGDIEIHDPGNQELPLVLRGRADPMISLAWDPLGTRLISSDATGKLVAWRRDNAEPLAVTEAAERLFAGLVVFDPGELVAAIDIARRVRLWRLPTAGSSANEGVAFESIELPETSPFVDASAITRIPGEPTQLAIGNEAGVVSVVLLPAGEIVRTIETSAPVAGLAARGAGDRLAIAGRDGTTSLWQLDNGTLLQVWQGDPRVDLQRRIAEQDHARQQTLLSAWSTRNEEARQQAERQQEALTKAETARDEAAAQLAANSKSRTETATARGELEQRLAAARQLSEQRAAEAAAAAQAAAEAAAAAEQLATELEAKQKAVVAAEEAVKKSEALLAAREQAFAATQQAAEHAQAEATRHANRVELEQRRLAVAAEQAERAQRARDDSDAAPVAVAFSGDGAWLATAHQNGRVAVHAPDRPLVTHLFDGPPLAEGTQLFAYDEQLVVSAIGQKPTAWSLETRWELQRTIGRPEQSPFSDRVAALDFAPDGRTLAVGSGPPSRFGEIKILAADSGRVVRDLGQAHSDSVLCLRFSPDGRQLASAAADKTVRLFDVRDAAAKRSLDGHTHHVLSVAWRDDLALLASASSDQSVKIWDPRTGAQRRSIGGSAQEAAGVAFLGATTQLVVGSADGRVRIYDANDEKLIRELDRVNDFLHAMAATPDGQLVVAGGRNGVVTAWTTDDGKRFEPPAPAENTTADR